MAVHAQVGETEARRLAAARHERRRAGKDPAVEGEDVEVGHHRGVRGRRQVAVLRLAVARLGTPPIRLTPVENRY